MAHKDKEGRLSPPIRGKKETNEMFEARRRGFLKATGLTEWTAEEEKEWTKEQTKEVK